MHPAKIFTCAIKRSEAFSALDNRPVFIADPLPEEIDEQEYQIEFQEQGERAKVGSILWTENRSLILDVCHDCRTEFWRDLIMACPVICNDCFFKTLPVPEKPKLTPESLRLQEIIRLFAPIEEKDTLAAYLRELEGSRRS